MQALLKVESDIYSELLLCRADPRVRDFGGLYAPLFFVTTVKLVKPLA